MSDASEKNPGPDGEELQSFWQEIAAIDADLTSRRKRYVAFIETINPNVARVF